MPKRRKRKYRVDGAGENEASVSVASQLLDALEKIDRPGAFCTSGRLPTVLPGLEVAGVGPIALPLGELQAAELKERAHQAPYGKGTRTLVDTNVRRVWEIDAKQVKLTNPEWEELIQDAVGVIQFELGLEKQKLSTHLYKLLFYEPGCFFLPHRDGEKLDRMVATLVIVLPSAHKGGELIVRHEGREETIDFGGPESRFRMHFAAFYADCEHEIRPVKSGYRLCLTYNLTLARSKKTITAPVTGPHVDTVGGVLARWRDAGEPAKLAVILDHQYTQQGLTSDALKGVDRAKARVLFEAARQVGCDAHLALVTLWQCGAAEPSGYGYGYDDDGASHEMGEVIDESLTAEHFTDWEGNRLSSSMIHLKEQEIVSREPLSEGEADEEDFEGYTGNAGMTLDRWYYRAAVVIQLGPTRRSEKRRSSRSRSR
jgi:hypothetical protein